MRLFFKCVLFFFLVFSLVGCGEDPKPHVQEPDWDRLTAAKDDKPSPAQSTLEQTVSTTSAGGVTLEIVPKKPSVQDCLSLVMTGQPGRSAVIWTVNGQSVPARAGRKLCGDSFKRGDQVTATVGTHDAGASMTIVIGNAPPRVSDISATPDQVFAGSPVTVYPVGDDADGDLVEFDYQWLVNGNADPFLTDATLPGDAFTRGDSIQVLITPSDGLDKGEVYESYPMTIPNAPPRITSTPPQNFEAHIFSYQVDVLDPDDTVLTYHLNEPPAGMTINAAGLVNWPLTGVEPGDHTISITVTDADGASATQEFTLTLQ